MLLPNRNHRLPNLFPESSSRFDVTTAGQMKEKWRQACRIPIYLSRPLHRGVPRSNAFMRECAFAVRFPLFFFILFFLDGRASIHRPRACRTWIFSRLFSSDDRYSVRHRVKYKSHRELEYTKRTCSKVASRPPLSFVFQRAFSMIGTRVPRGRFGSRMFFVLRRDYVKYLMRFLLLSWLWLQFGK